MESERERARVQERDRARARERQRGGGGGGGKAYPVRLVQALRVLGAHHVVVVGVSEERGNQQARALR